LTAIFLT